MWLCPGTQLLREGYGGNRERLSAVKAKYDPGNLDPGHVPFRAGLAVPVPLDPEEIGRAAVREGGLVLAHPCHRAAGSPSTTRGE
ncbi:BBE domain-containing protein [Streptomyces sp. NPDC005279]|uniref:BBE domain-containing protein n=1 Tax=Streptomyces sp. NPDC005279 TaxID=3364712 RepID=UPI0036905333